MEKETIKINIDKNKTINLCVDKKSETENIIEMIRKGTKDPFKYFDTVKKINFDIELIYSREEFNNKLGTKTPDWLVASAFTNKFIIFEPSKIEKYTCHKKEEFTQLIAHETSHILLKELNPNYCAWMNEGVALNIAKQDKIKNIKSENISHFIKNNLFKNSKYDTFIEKQGYDISYKLVRYLLKNYSKKKMLDLFKIKYSYTKSAEKDACRILNKNKSELINQFTEFLS